MAFHPHSHESLVSRVQFHSDGFISISEEKLHSFHPHRVSFYSSHHRSDEGFPYRNRRRVSFFVLAMIISRFHSYSR